MIVIVISMSVKFIAEEWGQVSDEAKNLICYMLTSAEKRLSAEQVLQHDWFKIQEGKEESHAPLKLNFQALKNFRNAEKMKKVALTYIASQLSEHEILELNKLFHKFDKNHDGTLTYKELQTGI